MSLLISIIVLVVIVAVLLWLIRQLPVDGSLSQILQVAVIAIAIIVLLGWLVGWLPGPHAVGGRW